MVERDEDATELDGALVSMAQQHADDELDPGSDDLILEADDIDSDADSAIAIAPASTYSLISSVRRYQEENGRTYHGYEAGKYVFPNDERERDRMDIEHFISLLQSKGKLCLSPKEAGARRVLDLGTGTGAWAIEYADAHPEAEVIGVDISPIQPEFVPANCSFEIDDLEKEWTWTKRFDFIHCRFMNAAFADWPAVIRQVYDRLEPGGYFEFRSAVWPPRCDDGTLRPDSAAVRYADLVVEATERLGRSMNVGSDMPAWLQEAGFEGIKTEVIKEAVGPWPRDPHMKEIGMWKLESVDAGLEAFALAPLTRALGWTEEEVLMLCAEVRSESRDMRTHAYFNVYIIYARKPHSPAS